MNRVHAAPRLWARPGVRHLDVPNHHGIHPSLLSAILNERGELSPEFEQWITKAVDLLEEAEKPAREARQPVLAGQRGMVAGLNDDLSAVSVRSGSPARFRFLFGLKSHGADKGGNPEKWRESLRVKEQTS